MRRHVQRLLLPPGLGYSGLVGMVAGHACAGLVDLSRLERHIARLNAEELAPQVKLLLQTLLLLKLLFHEPHCNFNCAFAITAECRGAGPTGEAAAA
jgi:hypothetical protein